MNDPSIIERLPDAWWQTYVACLPDDDDGPSVRTERVFIEVAEGPMEFVRADIHARAVDRTVRTILDAFARKLTELDARSVRLGGQALSLGDPRDIAGQIHTLARTLEHFASWGEDGTLTAEALGAQVVAFLLARARVDELRVDAGGEAA